MTHARLLVVTGLPGSGKSELARSLARDRSAALVAKDTIKETLMDSTLAAGLSSRQLSDLSFAILFALTRESLATGADLVLEGNFRALEHEPALQAALPAAPVTIAQILCRAPESIRQQRLAARATDPGRHPGHRAGEQQLAPACDAFLELPGERLVVSTGAPLAETLATYSEQLRSMLCATC